MKDNDPFMKVCGDYMAAAIDIMVRTGAIDARSPAADARLCWGDPWPIDTARRIFENAGHMDSDENG
jgi:hypothetical protein